MWELYQVLKEGAENKEEYLIDEIFEMLNKISKEDFLQSLLMMFPKIDFTKHNPVEMATLFISGLKKNEFFAFVDLVKGLDGNSKR
jgi:hypothetical protein